MTAEPVFELPPGACDCHVHVFGDPAVFPYAPGRGYTPGLASLQALQALHASLGITRTVIVQPSPYGTDNACTLDAMRRLGDAARGVAVIDDGATQAELKAMHEAGVRGVRLNLETAGQHDPVAARDMLSRTADRVAPLGWHVQTYTNLAMLEALAETIEALPTILVVDHFGRAQAAQGRTQPGLASLVRLLESRKVYVKLSAAYRVSTAPDYADAVDLARFLLDTSPDRMLWGTDWPHPGWAAGGKPTAEGITPFRQEDDARAMARLIDWTRTPERLHAVLVDNPARLYGFGAA